MSYAARLDRVLRNAGFAIEGVSIGTEADRATWRVQPSSLQAACQPTIDTVDLNDPVLIRAEQNAEIDGLKALRALAQATYELKSQAWTQAQFVDRIKAIYRSL